MKSLLPSCFRPVVRAGRPISDSEEGHYRHIFIVAVSCVGLCVCARESINVCVIVTMPNLSSTQVCARTRASNSLLIQLMVLSN